MFIACLEQKRSSKRECIDDRSVSASQSSKHHIDTIAEVGHQLDQDIARILDCHYPAIRDLHGNHEYVVRKSKRES